MGRMEYLTNNNMKIIRNKYIPFKGFRAINLFGILFVRGNAKIDDVTMNHESVHSRQWIECGIAALIVLTPLVLLGLWWLWLLLSVFAFYILYVIEWFVKLFVYKFDKRKAYRNVSFEREAYANEDSVNYLNIRGKYAWFSYIQRVSPL